MSNSDPDLQPVPNLGLMSRPLVLEEADASFGLYYVATDTLCRRQSPYQDIFVFDTDQHGRVMLIGGQHMLTSTTHAYYGELMAHVPAHLHPDPRTALVIGGGDGSVIGELLRHPSIERIVLAELDEEVCHVTREFFPDLGPHLDHPKVDIRIGDGAAYVAETDDRFDIVVIDSTDPYLDTADNPLPLVQPGFYRNLRQVLTPNGVGSQIIGSALFNTEIVVELFKRLGDAFPLARPIVAPIPLFASGSWVLAVFANAPLDPFAPRACVAPDLRYYNADVHRAVLALPNDIAALYREAGGIP